MTLMAAGSVRTRGSVKEPGARVDLIGRVAT
jgi:hypothetical protein